MMSLKVVELVSKGEKVKLLTFVRRTSDRETFSFSNLEVTGNLCKAVSVKKSCHRSDHKVVRK